MNKTSKTPTPQEAEALKYACQIPSLQPMSEGPVAEQGPLLRRIRLAIRNFLGPRRVQRIKTKMNLYMDRLSGKPKVQQPAAVVPVAQLPQLEAGDWVRVKSREEIDATLNHWKQLRGCAFMEEMAQYCGTTQKVLKPVKRFVDERDLRVLKSTGIVLLADLNCQGVSGIGACDRNCFYFWRVEWLEKIPQPEEAQ